MQRPKPRQELLTECGQQREVRAAESTERHYGRADCTHDPIFA
jgi:hypothetical protein